MKKTKLIKLCIVAITITLSACNNTSIKSTVSSATDNKGITDKWKVIKQGDRNMSPENIIISFTKDSIIELSYDNQIKTGKWFYSTPDMKNIEIRIDDKISRMEQIKIETDKLTAQNDGQNTIYYRYGSDLFNNQSTIDEIDNAISRSKSDIMRCEDMMAATDGNYKEYPDEVENFKKSRDKFIAISKKTDLNPEQKESIQKLFQKYDELCKKLKLQ